MIREHGVVSEPVARAMATGVAKALGTSVGLGVTGIAGPEGGSEEKPVGTVCFAVSIGSRVESRTGDYKRKIHSPQSRYHDLALGHLFNLEHITNTVVMFWRHVPF